MNFQNGSGRMYDVIRIRCWICSLLIVLFGCGDSSWMQKRKDSFTLVLQETVPEEALVETHVYKHRCGQIAFCASFLLTSGSHCGESGASCFMLGTQIFWIEENEQILSIQSPHMVRYAIAWTICCFLNHCTVQNYRIKNPPELVGKMGL